MHVHNLAVGALAILAIACQSTRPAHVAPDVVGNESPLTPVAKFGRQIVTARELDDFASRELKRLDERYQQQRYELRRQALELLIRHRLLDEKASAAGITADELLKKEVLAKMREPADEDISAVYERAKASGQQLPPFDQVKGDIARFLNNQKAQGDVQTYYERLSHAEGVEILLPVYIPPKVQVVAAGPAKGAEDAPVTIVEFSDYQCPYCVRAEATVNELLATYPGKIRLVYRDFPLPSHALAPKAAEAAHCAGDQNKYWEMHDRLFAADGKLEVADLKRVAREIGVEGAAFDSCVDSGEKASMVAFNRKAGEEAGVNGTPAFFVNGRLVSGAQPLDAFKPIIDEELKAAHSGGAKR